MCDCRRGFGLDIGFIDHLYTRLGTIINYSATDNLHTLQITTANAMSFPACCVFTSHSLVNASNTGDTTSSALRSSLNGGSLQTDSLLHSFPYGTDYFQSQNHSYLTTGGLPANSSSWRQVPWDSRPELFQLNTCGHSPHATSSLMRGWIRHLQLLLVLDSAVILRSESRGTRDHILLSQTRASPNLEGQVPVFISPREQGRPGIGFPFRRFLRLAGLRWRYANPPPHTWGWT
jgi:hypothetical protein